MDQTRVWTPKQIKKKTNKQTNKEHKRTYASTSCRPKCYQATWSWVKSYLVSWQLLLLPRKVLNIWPRFQYINWLQRWHIRILWIISTISGNWNVSFSLLKYCKLSSPEISLAFYLLLFQSSYKNTLKMVKLGQHFLY